ncbi:GH1 family beta-glucosidase [Nocardioides mangrovi]|uniref:Beta-glucosidase n=1 Tax=Nocardioides mangrovi TaxID=2874580 RepID=A0ABS7UDB8_9ACTN|nr:GH1 family beta-glucosidase [Nocardioides mangrovi]MBZ5738976.1 beta-glucosidase [Nocardioides mangrovi]
MSALPERFVLGAATAAYQIEGAAAEDGRGPSIWDVFSHTPGTVRDGDTGDVAADHYHRLETDLDLIASLGLDAYRFSISWSRVLPTGTGAVNEPGLDFYERLVDGLLERGVEPVATLYHWDLPQELQLAGGWTERATSAAFAGYAEVVGRRLGDRVRMWTTLNEPFCSAYVGHAEGRHAPGVVDEVAALRAVHHLNLAHGQAVAALRGVVERRDALFSVTHNLASLYPADPEDPEDLDAVRQIEALHNRAFAEPQLRGVLPDDLVDDTRAITDWSFVLPGDLERIHQPLDVLGINYYTTGVVARGPERSSVGSVYPGATRVQQVAQPGPHTEMGWHLAPEGLYDLLAWAHRRYPELELMITENGAAFEDTVELDGGERRVHDGARVDYLRTHLAETLRAVDDGIPVTGYFVWSLMDNFEWAHGYSKRFGITHVDYATQERTLKDSGRWVAELARTRTLPH